MTDSIELSVVIPVFNEQDNLVPLLEELTGVLKQLGKTFEIICVNDASTDNSLQVLKNLQFNYPELRILIHKINSGESACEATGFRAACGSVIITIDADLQNDPADIPAMLKALSDGVDCVCGVRQVRKDNFVKRISSYIANVFRNLITGDSIQDAGCTFRAIRSSTLNELMVFNGMHRFLPSILRAQHYHIKEIMVNHRHRHTGYSKYGISNRLWRGILDCLVIRWYRARALRGDRLK